MFNLFKLIWEYLFSPWKIEVEERGTENWTRRHDFDLFKYNYKRDFITYKYTHRFRPEVKIVKKYLN